MSEQKFIEHCETICYDLYKMLSRINRWRRNYSKQSQISNELWSKLSDKSSNILHLGTIIQNVHSQLIDLQDCIDKCTASTHIYKHVISDIKNIKQQDNKKYISRFFISPYECSLHSGVDIESSNRYKAIDEILRKNIDKESSNKDQISEIKYNIDEMQVVDTLYQIHSLDHVARMIVACDKQKDLSSECPISKDTWSAAIHAAGSVIQAVKYFETDKNTGLIFCNVRPPGHHAKYDFTHGFCYFNNVLAGAYHANKLGPVVIFDWDVHHGDGTDDIIRKLSDNSGCLNRTYLFNIYESDIFPRISKDKEHSNICNFGFTENFPRDEYLDTFELIREKIRQINPYIIIISCGFDSASGDPLGKFNLLPKDYKYMTKKLLEICPRIISVLEGGYDITNIRSCITAHMDINNDS